MTFSCHFSKDTVLSNSNKFETRIHNSLCCTFSVSKADEANDACFNSLTELLSDIRTYGQLH